MTSDIRTSIAGRIDALNRHDFARLESVFADDCAIESPTGGGTVKGRARAVEIDRAWVGAFPDAAFATDDLLIDGDRVAWVGRAEGTATGEFLGLPPTGKPFDVPMVFVSTFRGNRVVHERRIYDFTGMLIQLGLLRPRPSAVAPPKVAADPPVAIAPVTIPRDTVISLLARRREAWARHDVAAIASLHAATCVMDSHLAGRVVGPDEIERLYGLWFGAFSNATLGDDGPPIVDGNRAAESVRMQGTDTGGFLGLPATGRPFELRSVWLYTVSGNQFAYVRPIYDFTGMLVQIGLLKARPV